MKKFLKTAITFGIAISMALGSACYVNTASVEAAAKTTSKSWKKAYLKIVQDCNKKSKQERANHSSKFISYTPYSYDLIYFNNDNIPELVVGKNGNWVSMYTYNTKTKKACALMEQWGYGVMGNTGYSYAPKKNYLYNLNNDYAGAVRNVYCMKIKNYKLVSRHPKPLKILHFKDTNKNGYPDNGEKFTEKPFYYYGNKKITQKKFMALANPKNLEPIIGKMNYTKIRKKLLQK